MKVLLLLSMQAIEENYRHGWNATNLDKGRKILE